jgi:hypothetical protein
MYIDMSSDDRYATNFEQLLRWLYDKPTFVKPTLGEMPAFLKDNAAPSPTRSKAKRASELARSSAPSAHSSSDSYLDSLIGVLETFRIPPQSVDFPQAVLDSIDAFLPYRDEFIEVVFAAAPQSDPALSRRLQRFFESAITLLSRPESVSSWRDWDFDNYVFIIHELFLYVVAILLRHERFETIAEILDLRFYAKNDSRPDDFMQPFSILWKQMTALNQKQQELRRISLRADLLEKRSHTSGLKFATVMMADFVLFLRSSITDDAYRAWYPETLLYTYNQPGPFEIFARAESKAYFKKISPMIGFDSKAALEQIIATFSIDGHGGRWLPQWSHNTLGIGRLSNVLKLESRP